MYLIFDISRKRSLTGLADLAELGTGVIVLAVLTGHSNTVTTESYIDLRPIICLL